MPTQVPQSMKHYEATLKGVEVSFDWLAPLSKLEIKHFLHIASFIPHHQLCCWSNPRILSAFQLLTYSSSTHSLIVDSVG